MPRYNEPRSRDDLELVSREIGYGFRNPSGIRDVSAETEVLLIDFDDVVHVAYRDQFTRELKCGTYNSNLKKVCICSIDDDVYIEILDAICELPNLDTLFLADDGTRPNPQEDAAIKRCLEKCKVLRCLVYALSRFCPPRHFDMVKTIPNIVEFRLIVTDPDFDYNWFVSNVNKFIAEGTKRCQLHIDIRARVHEKIHPRELNVRRKYRVWTVKHVAMCFGHVLDALRGPHCLSACSLSLMCCCSTVPCTCAIVLKQFIDQAGLHEKAVDVSKERILMMRDPMRLAIDVIQNSSRQHQEPFRFSLLSTNPRIRFLFVLSLSIHQMQLHKGSLSKQVEHISGQRKKTSIVFELLKFQPSLIIDHLLPQNCTSAFQNKKRPILPNMRCQNCNESYIVHDVYTLWISPDTPIIPPHSEILPWSCMTCQHTMCRECWKAEETDTSALKQCPNCKTSMEDNTTGGVKFNSFAHAIMVEANAAMMGEVNQKRKLH